MIGRVACVVAVVAGTAVGQGLPFEGRLKDLAAANPGLVEVSSIGKSRGGRDLPVVRLGEKGERTSLVIVAGLNGMHRVGTAVAVELAGKLAADHKDLLKSVNVFIVPCMNPDTMAWHSAEGHPAMDWSRTISPRDQDRDARVNEDGAEDLNGDGIVSMMRVKNPPAGSPLRAEYMVDPENAKLLKKPDAAKGEKAEYALLVEGIDNDGDGKFNEDGVGGSGGGVEMDMNFPYRWPEQWTDGAGRFALSEPETRALTEWMLKQKHVAAVLVYGPGDTLVTVPQAGRFDVTGQVPLGIEEGDKAAYEMVSKLFKDATKQTAAPTADKAGSFWGWAYAHYGVYSFETPVWVRPEPKKEEEEKKDEKPAEEKKAEEPKPAEAPAAEPASAAPPAAGQPPAGRPGRRGAGGPGGRGAGARPADAGRQPAVGGDDAKWLAYDEERVKAGDESGFVEWTSFDHPQLGAVEIGGFRPGFKMNPPPDEVKRLTEEQAGFVGALCGKFAKIAADPVTVERVGDGMWRVSVRVRNDGLLPTQPAMGVRARRGLPTILELKVPLERMVAGEKIVRVNAIAPGATAEAEWMVTGDGSIEIEVRPSAGAAMTVPVKLGK